ncbi:MAG: preprotein translocase subunit SecG [Holosporaceae bacterium]|jgi:preprotein translocase subunit SecG|nr:preprotein translocase subunit SecG [Holosporaceae bacterium]
MLSFLLAVHFVLTIAIIGLILLQKHDSDGALGTGGSSAGGMFSVRGQANLLTRTTAVLMTVFILNCLVMAKMTKRVRVGGSVIDQIADESVPANVPPTPRTTDSDTKKQTPTAPAKKPAAPIKKPVAPAKKQP